MILKCAILLVRTGVPLMVAGKQHGLRSFVVLFFAQVLLK